MNLSKDWEPRTLQYELDELNCYLILSTLKYDYLGDNPPNVYIGIRSRIDNMVGMFIVGQITLDGSTWLIEPKVNEGVLNAGYYSHMLDEIRLPNHLIRLLEEAVVDHKEKFAPFYAENLLMATGKK
jgi:hypothetical protein